LADSTKLAREHVVGHQLDALGQQRVHLDEALTAEQAVAQAGSCVPPATVGIRLT
jgi:hypothetical protein